MAWRRHARQRRAALWCALASFALPSCPAQHASSVEATTVEAALPAGVAYDAAGNLYLALANDHVIRKVDPNGLITTVAGTGEQGYAGDGGAATSAQLDSPMGVAVDASGDVFIADSHNHCIREVVNGTITTIAGTGTAGFAGDGGAANKAQFDLPTAISLDAAGNLYVADTNNQRIRRISGGTVSTVAGTGEQGFAGDGQAAAAATLNDPMGVTADPTAPGRFYIGDTHNQRLRVVDASGNISTVAGTGALSFSGDGAAAGAAGLATPMGVAVDASGTVYLADTDNQRIRTVTDGVIRTFAGDGEQGFAGDVGTASLAILDTPFATAVNGSGVLAMADTHNGRVRSVAAGTINTVAGIAPPLTEGLLLSGPIAGTFETTFGNLTATFSNGTNVATGSLSLNENGSQIATATLSGNAASFPLALAGGLHTLTVTYAGDAANAPIASGVYLVRVGPAAQTITFAALTTPVTYTAGETVALAASASSGLPVTYTITGPASISGSTLSLTGPGTVTVTASQAGNNDFSPASLQQTITVLGPMLAATSLNPTSVPLGALNLPISVVGSGFTNTSKIEVNGAPLQTTFVSTSLLTATLPEVLTLAPLTVTVYDAGSGTTSAALTVTVTAPNAAASLNVPNTSTSGQQPVIGLQLQTAYPVPIQGVLTLNFTPAGTIGVDDPAIQFSTGGRSYPFTIPANSTSLPSVAIQTGSVAGTITVTLQLTALGLDVTPASARSATILIPTAVPSAQQVTFTQSGSTLTVLVTGISNPRDMTQAVFHFTATPGSDLTTTSVTVPVADIFRNWFGDAASDNYGSTFLYTQPFTLSNNDSAVQSVTVTLTNSVGSGTPTTSQ